jgi:hypothetical protein
VNARVLAVGLLAVGLLVVVAGGCTSALVTGGTLPTTPPTTRPTASSATTTPAGVGAMVGGNRCSYRQEAGYVLPDPACTPGAVNPAVTPADSRETICARGWTATVRPPEAYTEALKHEQMDRYGATGSMSGYEEDHLIPLELGGSPADPKNLWPEPGASPNPKDDVEYAANRAVCSGEMTLAQAQREIAADWVSLGRALGVLEGTN